MPKMRIGEERTDNGATIWDYLQPSGLTLGQSKMNGILKSLLHSIPCWSCWRSQSCDCCTKSPIPFCGSCYGLLVWEPKAWSSVCAERWFFGQTVHLSNGLQQSFGQLITYVPCYDYGRQRRTRYHSLQCDGWWLGLAIRILSCSLDHSGDRQT